MTGMATCVIGAFFLVFLTAGPVLGQTQQLQLAGSTAQSLQSAKKPLKWTGCCVNCSAVSCSGCDSVRPGEACTGGTIKANCKTVSDITSCKPAR